MILIAVSDDGRLNVSKTAIENHGPLLQGPSNKGVDTLLGYVRSFRVERLPLYHPFNTKLRTYLQLSTACRMPVLLVTGTQC